MGYWGTWLEKDKRVIRVYCVTRLEGVIWDAEGVVTDAH